MTAPRFRFAGTVLSTPDPRALASFYERLLGWPRLMDEPGWVAIRHPDGGTAIAFQPDEGYRPPRWPTTAGAQQMMVHLDFATDDLERAVAEALAAGATLADHQPSEGERVLLDPDGHPFCLIASSDW